MKSGHSQWQVGEKRSHSVPPEYHGPTFRLLLCLDLVRLSNDVGCCMALRNESRDGKKGKKEKRKKGKRTRVSCRSCHLSCLFFLSELERCKRKLRTFILFLNVITNCLYLNNTSRK